MIVEIGAGTGLFAARFARMAPGAIVYAVDLEPAMVESLPSIGRDVTTLAAFQPGVTPSGSVAGTVADQAVFQLDGGNNSSDMDGSLASYTGSFGNSTTGGFLSASSSGSCAPTRRPRSKSSATSAPR